ncbi:MAG: GGDEF domain-containing protein [Schwartzia sp.]|nr:GGDEF domain-containing protein [Schwartzia sp. (in: firmicutes)]
MEFYYSSIGLLAIAILLIENYDIFSRREDSRNIPAIGLYRKLLYCILAYYVTDVLWGILDGLHLIFPLFVDTTIYYVAMASGVLFWTQYVIAYLAEENIFSRLLSYIGRAFFTVFLVVSILNCFRPVLFWFDENGVYQPCALRHWLLLLQVLLFLLSAVYMARAMTWAEGTAKSRYQAICLFGLAMAVLLFIQLYYPLLPLYSAGYMLGTSLLHTFVVSNEKDEYKFRLAESLLRENRQHEQLKSAWQAAYTDSLTGLKNKTAYRETEEQKNRRIADRTAPPFAIAVFDLNDLKTINDCFGHKEGDQYIIRASRLICNHFKHSPVFRVGGDEFVALLEGADFENRLALHHSFDSIMDEASREKNAMVIAMGLSDYDEGEDQAFHNVFARADHEMYLRKRTLKRQSENAKPGV